MLSNEQITYKHLTIIQNILERTPVVIGDKEHEELIDLIRKYRRNFNSDNIADSKNEWKSIRRILNLSA